MPHVPDDMTQAFFAGRRTASLLFSVNDSVVITDGPHKGRKGSVVVLRSIEPIVEFTIEMGDEPYEDIAVAQDSLMLLSSENS